MKLALGPGGWSRRRRRWLGPENQAGPARRSWGRDGDALGHNMQLSLGPGGQGRRRLEPEEAARRSRGRNLGWHVVVRPAGGGGRGRVVVGILMIVATSIDISAVVFFSLAAAPQGVPHGSV